jgi:hypothetical protein
LDYKHFINAPDFISFAAIQTALNLPAATPATAAAHA